MKNRLIYLLVFSFLFYTLLFQINVLAENDKTIIFGVKIHKDDTVEVLSSSLVEGSPTISDIKEGNYKIVGLTKDNRKLFEYFFSLSFKVIPDFEDPEKIEILDLTYTNMYFKLPYSEELDMLKMYKKDKVILTKKATDLICNKNNICNNFENYLSCPTDCPSGSDDNYCDGVLDGICDPNCMETRDIDCICGNNICDEKENEITCPEDCKKLFMESKSSIGVAITLSIILCGLIIWFIIFKKSKR